MNATELRIGNLVSWKNDLACIAQLWELETMFKCGETALYTELNGIELTDEWYPKLNIVEKTIMGNTVGTRLIDGVGIPEWIKSVHDLQNWYYYNFNKTELTINN